MDKIKLTLLQRELVKMKREKIQVAMNELCTVANEIAREHNIEEKDFKNWGLSADDNYIEKKEQEKLPT